MPWHVWNSKNKNRREYAHLVLVQSVDKCTACLLPDTPDGFAHRAMWDVLAGNGRHLLSIAVSQVAFNQSDQRTTTREDSWWIKLSWEKREACFPLRKRSSLFEPSVVLINLILKQGWTLISSEAFMVVFKGLSSHRKHTCRCHEVLPQAHLQRQPLAVEP